MEDVRLSAKGLCKQIDLLCEKVRIRPITTHPGPSQEAQGCEIPLWAITAVHVKKPGLVSDGYMQCVLEVDPDMACVGQSAGPEEHEKYTVVFHASHQREFTRLQTAIQSSRAREPLYPSNEARPLTA